MVSVTNPFSIGLVNDEDASKDTDEALVNICSIEFPSELYDHAVDYVRLKHDYLSPEDMDDLVQFACTRYARSAVPAANPFSVVEHFIDHKMTVLGRHEDDRHEIPASQTGVDVYESVLTDQQKHQELIAHLEDYHSTLRETKQEVLDALASERPLADLAKERNLTRNTVSIHASQVRKGFAQFLVDREYFLMGEA